MSTELAEYTYIDEFIVALATFVSNTGQMWVSLLAVFSNHFAVVELILSEEPLGIVVGIDVDFGQGIMGGWFIDTLMDTRLQPGQQQLQSVPLLNLLNKFICRELSSDDHDQLLDGILSAVNVQQSTNDNW